MSICGLDCCKKCEKAAECGGCEKCGGHPFGCNCIAAETIEKCGVAGFDALKSDIIAEINALNIKDLKVNDLNLLWGFYVNLEYPLKSGTNAKLLNDNYIYLGNQIEREGNGRCYGVVADREHILVCEYGEMGAEPEIILYKKRRISKNEVTKCLI